jgi:hypothetical protein
MAKKIAALQQSHVALSRGIWHFSPDLLTVERPMHRGGGSLQRFPAARLNQKRDQLAWFIS